MGYGDVNSPQRMISDSDSYEEKLKSLHVEPIEHRVLNTLLRRYQSTKGLK